MHRQNGIGAERVARSGHGLTPRGLVSTSPREQHNAELDRPVTVPSHPFSPRVFAGTPRAGRPRGFLIVKSGVVESGGHTRVYTSELKRSLDRELGLLRKAELRKGASRAPAAR